MIDTFSGLSMDFFSIFIWFSIVTAIFLSIKYRASFRKNMFLIMPYMIINTLIAFALSATYTPQDISLDQNLHSLLTNLIQLLRNSFLASVGLTLFGSEALLKPLHSWEEGFKFLKDVSARFLLSVIVGYALFSVVWFSLLAPEIFHHKLTSFFPVLSSLTLGSLNAINEEDRKSVV